MELGKATYQIFPSPIGLPAHTDQYQAVLSDPKMNLSMIKVNMKLATNCQFELDLLMSGALQNQPLSGDVSPPPAFKPQRIKLILATSQGNL